MHTRTIPTGNPYFCTARVIAGIAVAVEVGVCVGVDRAVNVGVGVKVAVGVDVEVAVAVFVGVFVRVAVRVAVGLGVWVGEDIKVAVRAGVFVARGDTPLTRCMRVIPSSFRLQVAAFASIFSASCLVIAPGAVRMNSKENVTGKPPTSNPLVSITPSKVKISPWISIVLMVRPSPAKSFFISYRVS